MDLHIPEPPPVQNKTFPLKMSGLNTSVEVATGETMGLEDIVSRTRERYEQQTFGSARCQLE